MDSRGTAAFDTSALAADSSAELTVRLLLVSAVRYHHHGLHPQRIPVLRLSVPGPAQQRRAAVVRLQGIELDTRQGNTSTDQ